MTIYRNAVEYRPDHEEDDFVKINRSDSSNEGLADTSDSVGGGDGDAQIFNTIEYIAERGRSRK